MKFKAGEYHFEGESAEFVDFFKATGVDPNRFFRKESEFKLIHYAIGIGSIVIMYLFLPIVLLGHKYLSFVYIGQLLLVGILAFAFHGVRKQTTITAGVAALMILITGLEWGYVEFGDIQKIIERNADHTDEEKK